MASSAAIILALMLILSGLAILGDALGWYSIPGDFWTAVIVVLGTASKFVSSRAQGTDDDDPAPPVEAKPNGASSKIPPAVVVLLAAPLLIQCSSPQVRADAARWASCTGQGALACAPAAAHEDPGVAAINYAACISGRAIGCVGPIVARENPPSSKPSPNTVRSAVDLGCVQDAAARCMTTARNDHAVIGRDASQACIEAEVVRCHK